MVGSATAELNIRAVSPCAKQLRYALQQTGSVIDHHYDCRLRFHSLYAPLVAAFIGWQDWTE